MSKTIRNCLFISSLSPFEEAIASACRVYHSLRQTSSVIALGQKYPTETTQFYTDLVQGDSKSLLNMKLGDVPDAVKPRVIQAMGLCEMSTSPNLARHLAREAMRWAVTVSDLYTVVSCYALLGVAFSLEGDHRESLAVLQEGLPVARSLFSRFPVLYFNYLNPLAVELATSKQFDLARRVIAVSLASPFARFYPEWSQTLDEINALDEKPSMGLIFLPVASPQRTELRLVRKGTEAMQAVRQPDPSDISVQMMGEIEEAVWLHIPQMPTGDKIKVLNYIHSLAIRAKIGSVSA